MHPFAIAIAAAAFIACAVLGWYGPTLTGWGLHAWARIFGGRWFLRREKCAGCAREVHVLVHRQNVTDSGLAGGDLCWRCAGGSRR
jgi:hypothetical protein